MLYKYLVIFFLLLSFNLYPQLRIEINHGIKDPINIAVVPFDWKLPSPKKQEFSEIIGKDLEFFGEFKVLNPEEMLSLPTSEEEVFYRDWKLLGSDFLVIGSVSSIKEETINVYYSIFDVSRKKRIHQAIIEGSMNSLSNLSHSISDRIYEKVNGIPGIFSTKIIYVQKSNQLEELYSLRITDINGEKDSLLLSSKQPLLSPDWSPEGDKVAYVSFEEGTSGIYIQELATGKRLLLKREQGINSSPTWSPNGRYLAAVLSMEGNPDIFLYDLKKKVWKQLTTHFGIDTEPAWSPNGKKLLFTSNRSGSPQIYEINLSTKKIRRRTFEGNYNARARFLPDGRRFILVHRREGLFHIAIQNIRTSSLEILTDTWLDESPTVSPNGNLIIYATKKNDKGILAGITVDGQTRFTLPSISGEVREPSWSPLFK